MSPEFMQTLWCCTYAVWWRDAHKNSGSTTALLPYYSTALQLPREFANAGISV